MEKIALKGKRFFEKNDYNILRVLSNKLEKDSYLANLQTSETSKTIEMKPSSVSVKITTEEIAEYKLSPT